MWSPGTSPPSAVAFVKHKGSSVPSVNFDGVSGEDLGADTASSAASADAWTQTGADNGVGGWAGEPGAGGGGVPACHGGVPACHGGVPACHGGVPACHGGGHPVVKVTELQARHRHLAQKLSNRPSKEVLVQQNILKGGQGAPHLPRILQKSQLLCRMSRSWRGRTDSASRGHSVDACLALVAQL